MTNCRDVAETAIEEATITAMSNLLQSESGRSPDLDFYDAHEWCLNPILTIGDLRRRIQQTWERLAATEATWQRDEGFINLYLLLCAMSCATDDYLSYRRFLLNAVARRFSRLGRVTDIAQSIVNAPQVFAVGVGPTRRARLETHAGSLCRCRVPGTGRPRKRIAPGPVRDRVRFRQRSDQSVA